MDGMAWISIFLSVCPQLLARAFQDMGQDDNDQYAGLALHLASDYLMDHQNKDVRLLVACCLADVFRIFAPDAPFKDSEHLKVCALEQIAVVSLN